MRREWHSQLYSKTLRQDCGEMAAAYAEGVTQPSVFTDITTRLRGDGGSVCGSSGPAICIQRHYDKIAGRLGQRMRRELPSYLYSKTLRQDCGEMAAAYAEGVAQPAVFKDITTRLRRHCG